MGGAGLEDTLSEELQIIQYAWGRKRPALGRRRGYGDEELVPMASSQGTSRWDYQGQ